MQGHPVDLFFPAVPVPPAPAIVEGAIVQVIAIFIGCGLADLAGYFWQG
jgi:hypothetical protein